MVPGVELKRRLGVLQQELQNQDIDGALIVQKVDYYYFAGTMQASFLFVPAVGEALLLVLKDWRRACSESPLENIVPCTSLKQVPVLVEAHYGRPPAALAMEFDVLPVKDYFRYQQLFPKSRLVDVSTIIKKIRARKSAWEIAQMQQAAAVGAEVYAQIPRLLRPGMTEIELGGLLEAEAKKRGHEGILRSRSLNMEVYSWHILSGSSGGIISSMDAPMGGQGLSPAFPVGASRKPIGEGEPILVDFGIVMEGYQVDQTRMYCIGKMPDNFRAAYDACVEIQRAILEAAKPGVAADYLYQLSVKKAAELGFGDIYLGPKGQQVRFVGHGIGLEINEMPFLAQGHDYPLEEGMSFAVEPKMVFLGQGAVGIEDTVMVDSRGCHLITNLPDEIIQV